MSCFCFLFVIGLYWYQHPPVRQYYHTTTFLFSHQFVTSIKQTSVHSLCFLFLFIPLFCCRFYVFLLPRWLQAPSLETSQFCVAVCCAVLRHILRFCRLWRVCRILVYGGEDCDVESLVLGQSAGDETCQHRGLLALELDLRLLIQEHEPTTTPHHINQRVPPQMH